MNGTHRHHTHRHTSRGIMVVLGAMVVACIGHVDLARAADEKSTHLEIKITDNGPDVVAGEPEVAINPKNPRNLYLVLATLPAPPPGTQGVPNDAPVPPHSCGGYVSMDGGQTWKLSALPFEAQSKLPYSECEDGTAAFGPDGTLYAGGDPDTENALIGAPPDCPPGASPAGQTCVEPRGDDVLARSTDGGLTWKLLDHPIGSPNWCPKCKFAPGSGHPHNIFDRPWVAVDQSTGMLYVSSRGIVDHERFIAVSTNKGDSFGPIYAIDSPQYPSAGGGESNTVAANGMVAQVYTAAPAEGGCSATCAIFETSADYGATWTRHVVTLAGAGERVRPFLAAFAGRGPSHKDSSFALSVLDATGKMNLVFTTHDLGKTWEGPTPITDSDNLHFKPWLAYTPAGRVVLLWRTWQGLANKSPYNVWAAVGTDTGHGIVFSAPLAVSSVAAPYATSPGGDDFSHVIADDRYIHASWGDSRNGATQVFYGRIPLSDFKAAH